MPSGLRRFHHSGHSHFLTFTCYHRHAFFASAPVYDLFPIGIESMRRQFQMFVYGYVVMPEHVHLLVSEPESCGTLADAMHFLKLSFVKRLRAAGYKLELGPFWQKRYYDRNIRNTGEFAAKLDYMHANPVKRGLVRRPEDWKWSSFRHYAFREVSVVEIESEWTARDRELAAQGGPARVFLDPRLASNEGREPGPHDPDTLIKMLEAENVEYGELGP